MNSLFDIDDRNAMLHASQKIGFLVHMMNSEKPPSPSFIAECAHCAAELVEMAMRLDVELREAERGDTEVA